MPNFDLSAFGVRRPQAHADTSTLTHTLTTSSDSRAETRRAIRSVLGRPATVGAICQALPQLTRGVIVRELGYLRSRGAIVWNGRYGPASRYVLQQL